MMPGVNSPYDTLPLEVRRESWGWFGQPWWSHICYDEDGRLLEEMRKPFPAGEDCMYCGEMLNKAAGDSGQAMPCHTTEGNSIRHAHKECRMRQGLGGLAHLEGRCRCHGGTDYETPGMTARQEALAVWAWVQEHGARSVGS
jgi:hypothetical protein